MRLSSSCFLPLPLQPADFFFAVSFWTVHYIPGIVLTQLLSTDQVLSPSSIPHKLTTFLHPEIAPTAQFPPASAAADSPSAPHHPSQTSDHQIHTHHPHFQH